MIDTTPQGCSGSHRSMLEDSHGPVRAFDDPTAPIDLALELIKSRLAQSTRADRVLLPNEQRPSGYQRAFCRRQDVVLHLLENDVPRFARSVAENAITVRAASAD